MVEDLFEEGGLYKSIVSLSVMIGTQMIEVVTIDKGTIVMFLDMDKDFNLKFLNLENLKIYIHPGDCRLPDANKIYSAFYNKLV